MKLTPAFEAARKRATASHSETGFTGSRWGDYSTTWTDPADPGIFWTNQEWSTTGFNNWATQMTELVINGANEARWKSAASGNFADASSWFAGAAPNFAESQWPSASWTCAM